MSTVISPALLSEDSLVVTNMSDELLMQVNNKAVKVTKSLKLNSTTLS